MGLSPQLTRPPVTAPTKRVNSCFASDSSSRWIHGRLRLSDGSISRFCISSLGRADYKGENCAYEHDASNHFEGPRKVARALAHVRDLGRPTYAGKTPGRQH